MLQNEARKVSCFPVSLLPTSHSLSRSLIIIVILKREPVETRETGAATAAAAAATGAGASATKREEREGRRESGESKVGRGKGSQRHAKVRQGEEKQKGSG